MQCSHEWVGEKDLPKEVADSYAGRFWGDGVTVERRWCPKCKRVELIGVHKEPEI